MSGCYQVYRLRFASDGAVFVGYTCQGVYEQLQMIKWGVGQGSRYGRVYKRVRARLKDRAESATLEILLDGATRGEALEMKADALAGAVLRLNSARWGATPPRRKWGRAKRYDPCTGRPLVCNLCREAKPCEVFYRDPSRTTGRDGRCRDCRRELDRARWHGQYQKGLARCRAGGQ